MGQGGTTSDCANLVTLVKTGETINPLQSDTIPTPFDGVKPTFSALEKNEGEAHHAQPGVASATSHAVHAIP